MITKTCKQCGKPFDVESIYSNRKFCDEKCRFKSILPESFSASECFEWPKSLNKVTGYGQFNISTNNKTEIISAHRMSYSIFNGDIKDGDYICHSCDNRACVNPLHLFSGSQKDNVYDMWRKNRQHSYKTMSKGNLNGARKHPEKLSRGVSHHHSKLTDDAVRHIRSCNESHASLARFYSVSPSAISRVRKMLTWTHVI